MYSYGNFNLNGKKHFIEEINGQFFVNGKPKLQWIKELDKQSKDDLNRLSMKIISGQVTKNFHAAISDFHSIRNN